MATTNSPGESDTLDVDPVETEDRERAVKNAYRSMSSVVAKRLDVAAETHWELYEAAAEAGMDGEALRALRRLTELYEQAVYAPGELSVEDSRWAVSVATHLEEKAR